jgi:subtilisin-like proprotein convertase family protein/subtilisin family serine protease
MRALPPGETSLATPALPTLSVADVTVSESDAAAVFTVSLSAASAQDVVVDYKTVNDIAVAGADYTAASGRLVIRAGSTSATFSVGVLEDAVFEPREAFAVTLQNPVNATIARGTAFGIINDNDTPASLALPADRHFVWQWSLFSPYGVNVLPVWKDYTGSGVRVAIFDQGIDPSQADLDANVLAALGRDAATLSGNGLPETPQDNHGTALAGVIAAERNGDGIVGIAYNAGLFSIYSPLNESSAIFGSHVANAYEYARSAGADIVNDSWGFGNYFLTGPDYAFVDDFGTFSYIAAGHALANLATLGRGALGTIVVQAAGNAFGSGDDTNLHNFQNSRYIITVAASNYFGNAAYYSSPGASILVTAPGGEPQGASGIVTTDRTGAAGYTATSDYVFVAGTSFSAAVTSGVVALMLDANPHLGYRDVQEILAYSAVRPGSGAAEWTFNDASNWNGGGLHFNTGEQRFGYGLIDATAAVRLAETWDGTHTAANLKELTATRALNTAIPDLDARGITDSTQIAEHMQVERVDVALNIAHSGIGDLTVSLQSPGGISSSLLYRPGAGKNSASGSSQQDVHFTFDTVAYWGEDAQGTWTLNVSDQGALGTGMLQSWTLTVSGKPASQDDVYIYTNEYSDSVVLQGARSVLHDSGGVDTLNAAAVTAPNLIDLTPGATSIVDNAPLTIDTGAVIENAIGGDDNDRIFGNDADNWLRGMRGDDTLMGGGGNDILDGGPGNDRLDGGSGLDIAIFALSRAAVDVMRMPAVDAVTYRLSSQESVDYAVNVERLQFSDRTIALDLNSGDAAGNAVLLIGAAFGAGYIPEFSAAGVELFDSGYDMVQVAQLALQTNIFRSLAASNSNVDFVDTVYQHVVGVAPTPEVRDFYVSLLQGSGGSMTQAELLVLAANAQVNEVNVDLVGLQQTGLEFA